MSSVLEHPTQRATRVLPLRNGDVLDQPTFHERYLATSDTFRAELIGGVVHVPSPVTNWHAIYHADVMTCLGVYRMRTPGTALLDNGTIILDDENEPQPDAVLRIDESCGGASRVNEAGYVEGSPDLHVEVAYSSASIDLHRKRDAYRRRSLPALRGIPSHVVASVAISVRPG
jgi:Uma2 family endonuclease